tara:strand:- start:7939 stop:10299 length:2361 start_codon:yes stop_codon:yes gene_type:complete
MEFVKRIDIKNFGSYSSFVWKQKVKSSKNETEDFKKLNILYGRNYSGKTTLSRIFRSFEVGNLPNKILLPDFKILTDNGELTQLDVHKDNLEVRVYNKDFISDNLSFLVDDEGHISPIAIIGDDNTKIEQQIADKKATLGSVESKDGLYHVHELKKQSYSKLHSKITSLEAKLEKSLTDKANKRPSGIKHQTKFSVSTYNINALKADIDTVAGDDYFLSEDKERNLEQLIQDQKKSQLSLSITAPKSLQSLLTSANLLLTRKIKPSKPIQDLLDDHLLQDWVKQGRKHHEAKRETCGFCGNALPTNLWSKLDAHFDLESEKLESSLRLKVNEIDELLDTISDELPYEQSDFYSEYGNDLKTIKNDLKTENRNYKKQLSAIKKALIKRQKNIFEATDEVVIDDNSEKLSEIKVNFDTLIEYHNNKSNTLEKEQESARRLLRLHEVTKFIDDIKYNEYVANIEHERATLALKLQEKNDAWSEIQSVVDEIEVLDKSIKDEKKGADQVNRYLNNFFGHEGLQLEATDNGDKAFKFQIMRNKKQAHNLSEGECSLVAFCYFMAKLEDIESKGKKLIIYIDDPISSLDNNHIFFVYSLIESVLARPTGNDVFRYGQLFISTHNLDFLKYLKRLTKPKKQTQHFIISGKTTGSEIELMPDYMKNYVTEFNYLFSEIFKCSDEANATANHESFYNFGNNLRKFLEAYLFFKYPFSVNDRRDHDERITKFFGGDEGAEPLVQRIVNEFSHLAEMFDRSVQPIDHAEISKLAKFVLKKIKEKDNEQYDYLVQSIG